MATTIKYLDLTGLTTYDGKLKGYITETLKNYGSKTAADNGQLAYDAWKFFLGDTFSSAPSPKLEDLATKTQINSLQSTLAAEVSSLETVIATKADASEVTTLTQTVNAREAMFDSLEDLNGKDFENWVSGVNGDVTQAKSVIDTLTQTVKAKLDTASFNTYTSEVSEEFNSVRAAVTSEVKELEDLINTQVASLEDEIDTKADASTVTTLTQTVNAKLDTASFNTYTKEVNDEITSIKNSIAGGVHFIGTADSLENVSEQENGDIVIVGNKEYIWDEGISDWVELGDTTAELQRIGTLESTITTKADKSTVTELNTLVTVTIEPKVTKLETAVSTLEAKVASLEGVTHTAITEDEINGLFS